MNARQRRQTRRAGIRLARAALPAWRDAILAARRAGAGAVGLGHIEIARAPGLVIEADDHAEPSIYVLRTYRVDGEERYEMLHREPPVVDCPECA